MSVAPIAEADQPAAVLPAGFTRLAWSNLLAQSAEQVGLAAVPLVAVLAFGAGAGATGLLQALQTLPFLLLSFPAGLVADRASRRRLMAGAEAVRAASLLAVLALLAAGRLDLPLLGLLGFIGAAGTVAYTVAAPALVPALVPRARLSAANGRLELARSVAFAAGPSLGGALVGWTGAPAAFALAAGLSGAAALLLAGLPEPARPASARRHLLRELRDGAGFVLGHRLLRPVLLTAVVFNTAWFVLQAAYVPYAVHALGLTAAAVGATIGCYGLGMVVGALLSQALARRLPFGLIVAIGPTAGLAAAITMALTIWAPSPWLAGVSFFLFGAGPVLWVISTTTLRQAVTPDGLLGRASAMVATSTMGARPIGAALGALIGSNWGLPACLLVAAAGFLVQFLVIARSPVPGLAHLPTPD